MEKKVENGIGWYRPSEHPEKKSYALPEMKRQKVGHWKATDWIAKRMQIEHGGMWPDLVWQEKEASEGREIVIVGELKWEGGELVLVKYDEEMKQWIEERLGPICWTRPGWRFADWNEELVYLENLK